ncbi:deoxyribonuclease IV [Desulfosediminicola flagellatus]|uniref:deoxyribonuclease IV n=1 Tax=Desulfosediminicola flagellatus TaxID=2569541 RepID=UPI0010AB921D|nr:deoxyribonuclease IV [Desulfosediminicola flagellatus]
MALFGAHESVAGGLYKAFERIDSVGGESLQIFTRNQRQWKPKPLTQDEITCFKEAQEKHNAMPVASHGSYLINLATAKDELLAKSIDALELELERCSLLGVPYVVLHPGSHGGDGVEAGLERFVAGMDNALESGYDDVMLLIETTAGQGTGLGSAFNEIAYIREHSRFAHKIGVCVDTCHIFAAGYDLRSPEAYEKTIGELESTIGLEHIKFFHLNDSKKECGCRVDRHEHIGKGAIGLEGFKNLVNDSRFAELPMTLETPKGEDLAEDRENIEVLRGLIEG